MKKIYLGHPKRIDYLALYEKIENDSVLKDYDIIMPHKESKANSNTREFYNNIDIFIAEVSEPATGLGIELGWAFDAGADIYCFSRENVKVAGSLKSITNHFITYSSLDDFILKLSNLLQSLQLDEPQKRVLEKKEN